MNSKKGGKQNRSQALDLGFSNLLGQGSTPDAVAVNVAAAIENEQSPPPVRVTEIAEEAIPVVNPVFAPMVAAKDWRALSETAEAQLGAEEKDPEARLLWIIAQLEMSALPPFLLTPSYESVLKVSENLVEPRLNVLAHRTGEMLRAALRRLGENDLADALPTVRVVAPNVVAEGEAAYEPVESRHPRSRRMPLRQLGLLGIALLVCGLLLWSPFQSDSEGIAIAALLEPAQVAAPIVPLPPRPQVPNQLSALMYEFENALPNGPQLNTVSATQESAQELVTLSMRSPIEPPVIGALRRGERNAESGGAQQADGSSRREVDSQPREIFGAKSQSPRDEVAHMVQHFSKVRVYVVPTGAPVFSAASRNGSVLEELPPGAKVKVEGLEGEWLRLVSKSGRTGFVRRSDAEVFDPDVVRTRS